mgnify:CR=1 FL=1
MDLVNKKKLDQIMKKFKPNYIIHLAAQAGVRYSIKNPFAYVRSNLIGFTNILEISRNSSIRHLIYASSSSVYGASKKQPYIESDAVAHPNTSGRPGPARGRSRIGRRLLCNRRSPTPGPEPGPRHAIDEEFPWPAFRCAPSLSEC